VANKAIPLKRSQAATANAVTACVFPPEQEQYCHSIDEAQEFFQVFLKDMFICLSVTKSP
jgi:hypothetical protein